MTLDDLQKELKTLSPEKRAIIDGFIKQLSESNDMDSTSVEMILNKKKKIDISVFMQDDELDSEEKTNQRFGYYKKKFRNKEISLFKLFQHFQKRSKKTFFNQSNGYYSALTLLTFLIFTPTFLMTFAFMFSIKSNPISNEVGILINAGVCLLGSFISSIMITEYMRAESKNKFLRKSWFHNHTKSKKVQFNAKVPLYFPDAPLLDSHVNRKWIEILFEDEKTKPIILQKLKEGAPITIDEALLISLSGEKNND